MSTLVPCLSCNRHVRSGEACPFCGARASEVTATTSPLARTSRAALFAIATAACGPPAQVQPYGQPPPPPAASSGTISVAAYGAAPEPPPEVTPKR